MRSLCPCRDCRPPGETLKSAFNRIERARAVAIYGIEGAAQKEQEKIERLKELNDKNRQKGQTRFFASPGKFRGVVGGGARQGIFKLSVAEFRREMKNSRRVPGAKSCRGF